VETIEFSTKLAGVLVAPAFNAGIRGFGGLGLSFDVPSLDAAFAGGFRRVDGDERLWGEGDNRPTQAPVAAVAVHQGYGYAAAGAGKSQQSQQHHQDQTIAVKAAATTAAAAATMRALRGLEPWGKRT
jgi:hypothetical protein